MSDAAERRGHVEPDRAIYPQSQPGPTPDDSACDCESMGGRFGAHRDECPARIAFLAQVKAEERAEVAAVLANNTAVVGDSADDGTFFEED